MSGAGGGESVPGGFTVRLPKGNYIGQAYANVYAPNEYSRLRDEVRMYQGQASRGEITEKEKLLLSRSAVARHELGLGKITQNERNTRRQSALSNFYKLTPEEEQAQWAEYNQRTKAEANAAQPYVDERTAKVEAGKRLRNAKVKAAKVFGSELNKARYEAIEELRRARIEAGATITTNPMFNQQRKEAEAMKKMVTESESGGSRRHRYKSRKNKRHTRRHRYTRSKRC